MAFRIVATLLFLTSFASAESQVVPQTPAGQTFMEWLTAFNSGDEAALKAFDARFRPDGPPVVAR